MLHNKMRAKIRTTKFDLQKHGVTQGLLIDFMSCRYKARLRMDGVDKPSYTSLPLITGSIFHDCLEMYYRDGGNLTDILTKATDKQRTELLTEIDPSVQDHLRVATNKLAATLPAYVEYWKGVDEKVKWESLEGEFTEIVTDKRLSVPVPLRGKIDGAFTSKGKRLWLFETKTKSMISVDNIEDALQLDMQVMMYMYALKLKTGRLPAGVVYNIIRTANLKQKQKETEMEYRERISEHIAKDPTHYFIRFEVPITGEMMSKWEDMFMELLQDFLNWLSKGLHYRNSNTCLGKFGRCKYLSYCIGDTKGYVTKPFVYKELET